MEWVDGREGTALNFTGTKNYVRVEDSPELNPTKGITIAAWINPSWTGNNRILQKGQKDSQYRLLKEWGDNLVFHLAGVTNGKLDGFSVPPIGEWTHVVATYDGSAMKVYYNGKVVGKLAGGGDIATTTEPLYIGTKHEEAPVDDEFSGILDEVRIYNCALSKADVAAIYAGKELPLIAEAEVTLIKVTPAEKVAGKLVAWWKFNETEGSEAADSSGSNLSGTLIGNPQWQPSGGKFGGALEFDGVDDYVETDYATDLPVWTVAVWVNSPAVPSSEVPSGPVHREQNYQINWNHSFDDFRGAAGVQVESTWYAASFGDLQANTWYHLAATYNGEDFKAYKDGVLITNNSDPSGNPDAESATLKFARYSVFTDYFRGTIDDVRIYNYALSEADIAAIYAGKKLGKGRNWIPVLVIVAIAVVATGLTTRKKKATT